jgi:hypothetical protein
VGTAIPTPPIPPAVSALTFLERVMKTIKTLVEIPAKYKWMAQDADGDFWAYTDKPVASVAAGRWCTVRAYCLLVGRGNPNPNWQNTLTRIYEYEDVSDE